MIYNSEIEIVEKCKYLGVVLFYNDIVKRRNQLDFAKSSFFFFFFVFFSFLFFFYDEVSL